MENLNITLIQTSLYWEDREKNIQHFTDKINSIVDSTDIIVLPEMFTTGFSMNSGMLAETMDGKTVQWMKQMAKKKNCAITGTIIIKENNSYYNRLFFVKEDGNISCYDKRHLYRMGNENNHFSPGEKRIIIEYKGWRICPLICYDLRFPVWSRNKNDYDLLIYTASWPEVRVEVWNILLKARALENQVYVAGLNRIGSDGMNLTYTGNSGVYSPKAQLLSSIQPNEDRIETITLSKDKLVDFRAKYPVGLDADNFEIIN